MILIITHKEDYTADFVINKLNDLGVSYFRFNCEDLLNKPLYRLSDDCNFEFELADGKPITSIWYRRTQVPDLTGLNLEEQLYFYREFDALLDSIYYSLRHCKWLSDPFAIKRAESKIFQLNTAKALGWVIPKTIVTNSKSELTKFLASNSKNIIKPLYSGYVPSKGETSLFFTSLVTEENINALQKFDLTPCIYQEYIEKQYELRITVVDGKVFSAMVDSQNHPDSTVDWRKHKQKFSKYDLPENVGLMCIELCKSLGIAFGAIDIIRSIAGEYIFLEINPNGQWAWLEMETAINISDAIIEYLNVQ
ncbi:Glutathione synthase/RimK-type ligase, ATP-grasp superfamily [Mucilaginibacter pineti]|uniref:Glutathione synthase/RimK-type ligase, ATP-grasp superfamily n=1 Tax=Mucilaginibacter pineti TaxID=1391627 RepID=A0A1G7GFL7_9SPHI|nr:hypothetical protein [Mucilaginibacter pineti]SDE86924.1 Glutathione synthase/RimK-type ligase, ATP-grasp superfamily [Mucilaginibacter pineti]